ncbi:transporter substrate-binding domain-containing protein [Exiguobacterium aurantiacum]|uniref:Transporter substrate-binding domain-containing protein n=1 Tax=Exiguobacterium aurantiacum TaxID=33987 RepID=A0ABY5FJD0_9BACL|nr:transporter substrate-binding domain-containing protein [Exiguobacterium aurantiacum]UTT41651.1 transporter substrate-binding domain-containing protein [Exiguobacterium aurantiacum]
MKKWGITGGLVASALLAGCSQETTGEEKMTLVMGTSADYFPYEFVDTANGDEIVGFDIEIAETVTERLGYELKIEDMDFGSLLGALNAGRVDFVMAGMTPTEERKENAAFSDIYLSATNLVMTKDESLESIEALAGKKIGVQTASIQENIAKDQAPEAELVSLNKIPEIVQELNTGRIDAMVIEDTVAQKYLDQDAGLYTFALKEDGEKGSAAAFKLEDDLRDQFNEELNKMIDAGEIDKLAKKWFSMEPTE